MKAKLLILLTLVLVLTSCSIAYKIRKENKKYNRMTSGLRYNSYKKLSTKSISLFVEQYNMKAEWKDIEENDVRVYVGFLMLIAQQNRLAAAEANIILDSDDNGLNRYSAMNLIASVKQQKGWEHIAAIDYEKAESYDIKSVELDTMDFGDFASELVLANSNIRNYNFAAATKNLAKLGSATGVKWSAQICVMLSEIKDGEKGKASEHYSAFVVDEDVPDNVKKWFAKEYPKLMENPEKLNNLSGFSKKMFRLFLTTKYTVSAAKNIKNIVVEVGQLVGDMLGGIGH